MAKNLRKQQYILYENAYLSTELLKFIQKTHKKCHAVKFLLKIRSQIIQKYNIIRNKMQYPFFTHPPCFEMPLYHPHQFNSWPYYDQEGLLDMMAYALEKSVSEFCDYYSLKKEELDHTQEEPSLVEIEDPNKTVKVAEESTLLKKDDVFEFIREGKKNKQNQSDKIVVKKVQQPLPEKEKFESEFNESSSSLDFLLQQKYSQQSEQWQPPTPCPEIDISSQIILKKKVSLLKRKVKHLTTLEPLKNNKPKKTRLITKHRQLRNIS